MGKRVLLVSLGCMGMVISLTAVFMGGTHVRTEVVFALGLTTMLLGLFHTRDAP